MMTKKSVAKKQGLKYFSQLTPIQKDKTHKKICEIIAVNSSEYIDPCLWGILFDVSFKEIMNTKKEGDKYCNGYCFKHKNIWIPLTVKKYHYLER